MIYVYPIDLSEFFLDPVRRKQLETTYALIAEQDDRKIYLTADNGLPRLHVEVDGEPVFDKIPESCTPFCMTNAFLKLLITYEIDSVYGEPDPGDAPVVIPDDDPDSIYDDQAQDRRERILATTEDMLAVYLAADPAKFEIKDPDLEDLSYHIGRFLMDEWGISMNYPTAVVHADGSTEVLDFPFDDPDTETEEVSE